MMKLFYQSLCQLPAKLLVPNSLIHSAAKVGNTKRLQYFLDKGIDPNVCYAGTTLLETSMLHKQWQNFLILLKYQADPNFGDPGKSPIQRAVQLNLLSAMRLLMCFGAQSENVNYLWKDDEAKEFIDDKLSGAWHKLIGEELIRREQFKQAAQPQLEQQAAHHLPSFIGRQ